MSNKEDLDKRFDELHNKLDLIMKNHLLHVDKDLQELKTNMDWLLKFFWIVATSSIGALLTALFGLIISQ